MFQKSCVNTQCEAIILGSLLPTSNTLKNEVIGLGNRLKERRKCTLFFVAPMLSEYI